MRTCLVLLAAAAWGVAAGCVAPDLQRRCDELLREQDDLRRQKADLQAELLACRARCESLEGGAPAPAAAPEAPADAAGGLDLRRRGNDTVIGIPGDVFFASGSSSLSAEGERSMARVVEYIRIHHPEGRIRVEGHADSDPIRQTKSRYHCNWELSFQRAHAVLHHLVDRGGVDPGRLVCESWGEFHPLDAGDKSRNRRVEILLSPGP